MHIGIVGTGSMGRTHAEAWSGTPAKVTGVVSGSVANARRMAQGIDAVAYASLEDMLPHVDVVDVCTPTPLHLAQTIEAARVGKHVVCEKPIARSVEDAQAMIDVCASAGVKLLVAHVVRYFEAYADAQARVMRGEVGPLKLLRLKRLGSMVGVGERWFADAAQSGGPLLDLMIHDFDFARWVAGDVVSVKAIVEGAWGQQAAQHASALLTHGNGAVTHVEGSWAMPPGTFRTAFDLIGERGRIEFDTRSAQPNGANPYLAQAQAFYQTLANDAPVVVTARDGLEALRIALGALESARTGREAWITPSYSPTRSV